MRFIEFLIEYDERLTVENHRAKLVSKLKKEKLIMTPERCVQVIASDVDPTKNKQYTQWLVRVYANTDFKLEDVMSTVADKLVKFDRLKVTKKLGRDADINQYKDFDMFLSVLDMYPDTAPKEALDKGLSEEVYNSAGIRILHIQDQTAAIYYGQGTKWCTAAKKNNAFSSYSKGLFILFDTTVNEKYQMHDDTSSVMDVKDEPVDVSDFVEHYPMVKRLLPKTMQLEPAIKKFSSLLASGTEFNIPASQISVGKEVWNNIVKNVVSDFKDAPASTLRHFLLHYNVSDAAYVVEFAYAASLRYQRAKLTNINRANTIQACRSVVAILMAIAADACEAVGMKDRAQELRKISYDTEQEDFGYAIHGE